MLDKIKRHKMLIAILTLLVVSNLFTIALFMSKQTDPNMRVNGFETSETNIMNDSPGSSWNGNVTNNQPVVKSEKVIIKKEPYTESNNVTPSCPSDSLGGTLK